MYARYISDSWHIDPVGNTYATGGQTSLALDSFERPHIAYWDYTHQKVGYATYDGVDWQLEPIAVMTGPGHGALLALALDSADHPHLCYYDYDTRTLNYVTHNGIAWQFDTVDDVSYSGQNCSIAIDSSDRPHISYRDLSLLYAHHDGTAWQITTVDDDFFAGSSSSLALDSNDMPHIGYDDWAVPDHDLRYAYFTGHSWWIEVIEVIAETRRFEEASLALDVANRPHIGYWDSGTNDVLKYAVRGAAPAINRVYLSLVVRQH